MKKENKIIKYIWMIFTIILVTILLSIIIFNNTIWQQTFENNYKLSETIKYDDEYNSFIVDEHTYVYINDGEGNIGIYDYNHDFDTDKGKYKYARNIYKNDGNKYDEMTNVSLMYFDYDKNGIIGNNETQWVQLLP